MSTTRINDLAGYCLDPTKLLLHRYYGSNDECRLLLNSWQEILSDPHRRSRLARKAAEGLYNWASENYSLDSLLELSSKYASLNRLPEVIERLKRNVKKDDTIRRLFRSPTNAETLEDLNSICGLKDSICNRFYHNYSRYLKADIINLLDYFVETLLEFKKLLPTKEKNTAQLEKLGLPTATEELIAVVKLAFEEKTQGELFSWWLTEQGFHSWCDVWLESNYDEALVKYLRRLDPDFSFPLEKKKPIKASSTTSGIKVNINPFEIHYADIARDRQFVRDVPAEFIEIPMVDGRIERF